MATTFYPPYNFGGDGIGIQRFARALVDRGHRVTVLQDVDPHRMLSAGDVGPEREDDGVRVIRMSSRLGPISVLLTQQFGRPVIHGREIARHLGGGDIDVINFHNVSLLGGPGVLPYGKALKIYMAHEHWLVCPSHVLWRHDREPCTGRQCLRCVLHYRRPPQLWRHTGLLERSLDHVDTFVAMSEFSRAKHAEFGFPRPMEVVNYFLPEPPAPPAEEEPVHPCPYFLFVGRLEKIKGLDTVLPLFGPEAPADLVVAGSGEDETRLKRFAGGSPRIHFLGRVASERLDRYYRQAVALIVPSVGFETFGIILIEAFRHGTPVVARRIGPFPEIVERCGGGILFENPEELSAALSELLERPERRAELGRAARRGFDNHWSEAAVVPRYLEVVRESAHRKGASTIADALQ